MQKFAMNHIHRCLIATAAATGTRTPSTGPPHTVRSGWGSGAKRLCGRLQGLRSASCSFPPPSQPQTTWPDSWTTVITHHDAMSRTTKKSTRLDTGHVHDGGAIATRTRWAAAIEPAYYHSQRHTSIALALALASCCRTAAFSRSQPTDSQYRKTSSRFCCKALFGMPGFFDWMAM